MQIQGSLLSSHQYARSKEYSGSGRESCSEKDFGAFLEYFVVSDCWISFFILTLWQLPGVMDPILEAIRGIVDACIQLFPREQELGPAFYDELGVIFSSCP